MSQSWSISLAVLNTSFTSLTAEINLPVKLANGIKNPIDKSSLMFFCRLMSGVSPARVAQLSGIKSQVAGQFFLSIPVRLSSSYSEATAPTTTPAPASIPRSPTNFINAVLPSRLIGFAAPNLLTALACNEAAPRIPRLCTPMVGRTTDDTARTV